jgi:hypothetical protein
MTVGQNATSALGILDSHTLGKAAVHELQRSRFDIRKWLVVGIQEQGFLR